MLVFSHHVAPGQRRLKGIVNPTTDKGAAALAAAISNKMGRSSRRHTANGSRQFSGADVEMQTLGEENYLVVSSSRCEGPASRQDLPRREARDAATVGILTNSATLGAEQKLRSGTRESSDGRRHHAEGRSARSPRTWLTPSWSKMTGTRPGPTNGQPRQPTPQRAGRQRCARFGQWPVLSVVIHQRLSLELAAPAVRRRLGTQKVLGLVRQNLAHETLVRQGKRG